MHIHSPLIKLSNTISLCSSWLSASSCCCAGWLCNVGMMGWSKLPVSHATVMHLWQVPTDITQSANRLTKSSFVSHQQRSLRGQAGLCRGCR